MVSKHERPPDALGALSPVILQAQILVCVGWSIIVKESKTRVTHTHSLEQETAPPYNPKYVMSLITWNSFNIPLISPFSMLISSWTIPSHQYIFYAILCRATLRVYPSITYRTSTILYSGSEECEICFKFLSSFEIGVCTVY